MGSPWISFLHCKRFCHESDVVGSVAIVHIMALPFVASAVEHIEFLDRNDPQDVELPKRWHRTVSTWSRSDAQRIVEAAQHNTSVLKVTVVPREMGNDEADVVASIVQSLPCIVEFQTEATEHDEYNGGNLPAAETVDRLPYGIVHNQTSQLTRFSTVYSVGLEAMIDLVTRFPSITYLKIGLCGMPCHVSESFALACVKAFPSLHNLETLCLNARCAPTTGGSIAARVGNSQNSSFAVALCRYRQRSGTTAAVASGAGNPGRIAPESKLTKLWLGCPESHVSIAPFLSGPGSTLSPSLTHLALYGCNFPDLTVFTTSTRSSFLSGIVFLKLTNCQFPRRYDNPVGYVCRWLATMPNLDTLLIGCLTTDTDLLSNRGDDGDVGCCPWGSWRSKNGDDFCLWRAVRTNANLQQNCVRPLSITRPCGRCR